jgi:hypothetical protein
MYVQHDGCVIPLQNIIPVRKSNNLCHNQSSGSSETCNRERHGVGVGSAFECSDRGNTIDCISKRMGVSVQGMTYGVVPQELYEAPVPVACAAAAVE